MLNFAFNRARWNLVAGVMILLAVGAVTAVAAGLISANGAMASLGGVLAALMAVSATILVQVRRDEVEQSKFFLESAPCRFPHRPPVLRGQQ
jgi:hypothetical protein